MTKKRGRSAAGSLQPLEYVLPTGRKPIDSSFNLGGSAAETDHLLATAYFDNGDYNVIASRDIRRSFIVGRTGSGKSAAFQHLREQEPGRVVTVNPESLAINYVTNLDAVRQLRDLGVHLEPFFRALWKHVIVVEILRHRYPLQTHEAKTNLLQSLRNIFSNNPSRRMALDYLDEFGDRFWCETDERVVQIADKFSERVRTAGGVSSDVMVGKAEGDAEREVTTSQETTREITARYQRVVNETQLARLNETILILNDTVLESPQHFTYLVIDDLDKEWVDDDLAVPLIRCLFDAVMDLSKVKHLKILIALRANLFRQLGYGSQRRGLQEEKIRGMVLELRWTPNDLRGLVEQRLSAASQFHQIAPPLALKDLIPVRGPKGDGMSYVLSRTLLRPRDVIVFFNAALREAAGRHRITWEDIEKAEITYSRERLEALRDEWKDPYFDIDRIFEPFRGKPARLDQQSLSKILDDVVMILADQRFRGTTWLTHLAEPILESTDNGQTWAEMYGRLVDLFFEISFLGLAGSHDSRAIYSYETERGPASAEITDASEFEVHIAFRKALDMK